MNYPRILVHMYPSQITDKHSKIWLYWIKKNTKIQEHVMITKCNLATLLHLCLQVCKSFFSTSLLCWLWRDCILQGKSTKVVLVKLEEKDQKDECFCPPKKESLCYGSSKILYPNFYTYYSHIEKLFNKCDNWNNTEYTFES